MYQIVSHYDVVSETDLRVTHTLLTNGHIYLEIYAQDGENKKRELNKNNCSSTRCI